jgi:hypothetical protein
MVSVLTRLSDGFQPYLIRRVQLQNCVSMAATLGPR